MGDEADALNEWGDIYEAEEHMAEQEWEEQQRAYDNKISAAKARYADNKTSPVKSTIRCAWCGKRMIKKSYQSQFCRNKGPGNCKDKFWNNTDSTRRERAQLMNS